MARIIPAVIPQSLLHLTETLETVFSFSPAVQVDIVDGVFVPFVSWPYVGQGSVERLRPFTEEYEIEIDLMVSKPETVIESYAAIGVRSIVVHLESIADMEAILRVHEAYPFRLGLSISNDTPLRVLEEHLDYADYVQLMGIAHIGSQGQPFDARVLERIRELHLLRPNLPISIDGSVRPETIPELTKAGANRLVSGSAILAAPRPQDAYEALSRMATT